MFISNMLRIIFIITTGCNWMGQNNQHSSTPKTEWLYLPTVSTNWPKLQQTWSNLVPSLVKIPAIITSTFTICAPDFSRCVWHKTLRRVCLCVEKERLFWTQTKTEGIRRADDLILPRPSAQRHIVCARCASSSERAEQTLSQISQIRAREWIWLRLSTAEQSKCE